MKVSISEAQGRLAELVAVVEAGETVVLTREGQPIARITAAETGLDEVRPVQWGSMRDSIKLMLGWDDPITEEELLGEKSA